MTQTLTCSLPSRTGTYAIDIGNGLLKHLASFVATLSSRVVIISDDQVASLYGQLLQQSLAKAGLTTHLFTFPHGETHKTRDTKQRLEDQLLSNGLGRDTCLIALGGGVATDIGGYVAATYCRGIPLVMAPTSLLGMVDASIGGKTGVNTPQGKNLIGCIYQPQKVVIDLSTLSSLPQRELINGAVEMIKHGVIADAAYVDWLEEHADAFLALDPTVLEEAIYVSCHIKKEIVQEDEQENGKRRLLNFGHTIGHALEKASHYSMSHGEAVAIGMLIEGELSVAHGSLSPESLQQIHRVLSRYQVPLHLPKQVSVEQILDAMILDKKSLKGLPRFVLLQRIGSCVAFDGNYCTHVDQTLVRSVLHKHQKQIKDG